MTTDHRLDRRAKLLANKIRHRIDVLRVALHPAGGDPPFTDRVTSGDALTFWRANRYSPVGTRVLQGWTPGQITGLDAWLARHPDPAVQAEQGGLLPAQGLEGPLPRGGRRGGPLVNPTRG